MVGILTGGLFPRQLQELFALSKRPLPMSPQYRRHTRDQLIYPLDPRIAERSGQPAIIRLRPRRRKQTGSLFTLFLLGFMGVFSIILLASAVVGVAYSYYLLGDRIFPGVEAGALDLGGMTLSEAALILDKTWNLETTLHVTNGVQSQILPPASLGITLDAIETAKRAIELGRSGSILSRLAQVYSGLKNGWQVQPVVQLNLELARVGLSGLAPQLSQPSKDATIDVKGADVVAVPAELGYTINVEETLKSLQTDPGGILAEGVLVVVPQPVSPAITDVTPLLAEARRLLDRPAAVQLYDPLSDEQVSYPIARQEIASMLRVTQSAGGTVVALDEAEVAAFLSELSAQIGDGRSIDAERFSAPMAESLRTGEPFWVTASHPPTSYVVQPGDTLLKLGWRMGVPSWMILQANPGMNPNQLLAGTEIVIPSKDELLPLPIVANKRIVINLTRQRLLVYQDGNLIGQHVISTGIDRSPTQPGIFQVQTHDPNAYASVWDLYMPNFLGIYEAWPGFMNGIHGLPLLSNGRRMWANSLGRPASYGCIILGLEEAEWLYEWAETGVIVEIRE